MDDQPQPGSVTQLMQSESEHAFWKLYTRFVIQNQPLQDKVKRLLPSDRVGDPVDILSDAFCKLWQKAKSGEHAAFNDRSNLISLLTAYAKNQASTHRKKHRPKGDTSVYGAAADGALRFGDEDARGLAMSEAELRQARESIEQRLASLESEQLRHIVQLAADGKTQAEIASELGYSSTKSIERAFDKIRRTWMAETIEEFEHQWNEGQCADFRTHFNQFPSAGRWLIRELAEIEIHQRMRRKMPISRSHFRLRAGEEFAESIDKLFVEQLFFDEHPNPNHIAQLRSTVDEWTARVLDLKLAGQTNSAIASTLKCSASNISDAMQFLREHLEP